MIGPDDATSPETVPPTDTRDGGPPRYLRVREHASGGLGEVWVALDGELNREVALKEIRPAFADRDDARNRFLLEAEVTGQLEHPGVVPVYGLGAHPDGRPYYAMRFIRGVTLHDAIAEFHRADRTPGRDPGERGLALRRLLARFVAVCHTLAYAHNRGVIHRDLKPANVMLGDFGETLVVDWGLARAVPPGGEQTAPLHDLRLPHEAAGSLPPGTVVGTVAFMPPEQARGEDGRAGPAGDVFGLGATLYALLAGVPPYAGADGLARAKRAAFAPPLQVKRSVPPALNAVCLRAMAAEPAGRYPSARALAEDVERWLADEPVSAYREPLTDRLRRWGRHHRLAVAVGLTLLLAAVIGLAAGLVAVGAEQRRTAAQRDRALAADRRAQENLGRAEDNLRLARKAVDECFVLARDSPLLRDGTNPGLRAELLRRALPFYRDFRRQTGDDPEVLREQADLLLRVGYITEEIGSKADALAYYRQALEAEAALADPARRGVLAGLHNNIGNVLNSLGQGEKALAAHGEALRLRTALAAAAPTPDHRVQLAETHHNLANLYVEQNRLPEARAALEAARTLLEQVNRNADDASRLAGTVSSLASVLEDLGEAGAAQKGYETARDIQARLVQGHPDAPAFRADLASTRCNLGVLLRRQGRADDAAREYDTAGAELTGLLKHHPGVPRYRSTLARVRGNQSVLWRVQGKYDEALRACQQAVELMAALVGEQPGVPAYRETLRNNRLNAARVLSRWSAASQGAEARTRAELGLEYVRQALSVPGYDPDRMRASLHADPTLAAVRALPGFARALEMAGGAKSP